MASKTAIMLLAAAALSGCSYKPGPAPEAGLAAVNVPVVSREDFVFDAAAPGGNLPPSEAARLDDARLDAMEDRSESRLLGNE